MLLFIKLGFFDILDILIVAFIFYYCFTTIFYRRVYKFMSI